MNNLEELFNNKKILVTGGTGSIGSEIVRQLLKFEIKQIRIFSRDESKQYFLEEELRSEFEVGDRLKFLLGDIRDKDRLDIAFEDIDIVFHAAALKHVLACESNPFEAVKTNVMGTQNVIDMAIKHSVEKFIAISTDKAVNPSTVMGITKLLAERLVTSARNYSGEKPVRFAVVRFGNVLNSNGSVIPIWIKQIKRGGPITVTDKRMTRFFMSIPEAVNLVFAAASIMHGEEIFVLKMPEVNIFQLAKKIIKEHANGAKIKIKFIGIRKREKIREYLYTSEEAKSMLKLGLFYILLENEQEVKNREGLYKLI